MIKDIDPRRDMAPQYDPSSSQDRWYRWWEERGYFKPLVDSTARPFTITIPPPNVTGDLHMGHALTYGIEDVVGRFKRMQGFNTLVLPGMDHAGIATQNVVERQLAREGLNRHDLGRERFVERAWEWKSVYAQNIRQQFQVMGAAFDWSRERFTMDDAYVDAVLEFFVRLYDEDKIYRGWRVINWCVRCHSAISDIEVADVQRTDTLYYLRYPIDGEDSYVDVATVRPETILGDVAVAVNPEDPRYQHLVGKTAILPLLERPLGIIADEMVRMEFGTGAVKITPAHDFEDFEVGQRHNLAMPIALNQHARVTAVGGPYEGLTAQEARENVLRDLTAGGFLLREESIDHVVPTCERCGTLLEPLLSEQWFVRMRQLAQPAIDVVNEGRVTFVPERWSRVYLQWMENIRDWTISRQLWWGHRIPVYYCANGHATAAKSRPEACRTCQSEIVRQDPDVLDTWFSSALWPFATLGWPQETSDLATFYPTSFMNTSSQILYLWIARMIMSGLKFMGDVPFPVVLINPTILNKQGQRMSKSLGTGIDPIDLVNQYGADALRFGLMTSGSTHQQEIRFSADKVEQARNFANKLWNVARFSLGNVPHQVPGGHDLVLQLTETDRWIISKLQRVIGGVTADLERYELSGAGQQIHDFVWGDMADWYVEMCKQRLYDDANAIAQYTARSVLWSVLDRVVRLLHPYMPFLTEEIWQHLRLTATEGGLRLSGWAQPLPDSVMIAPWPVSGDVDLPAERNVGLIVDLVRSIRAVRSEYNVPPGKFISAEIAAGHHLKALQGSFDIVSRLARLEPLAVYDVLTDKPTQSVTVLVDEVAAYLPLADMTDIEAEQARLSKDLDATRRQLNGTRTKLESDSFVTRAPQEVVSRERERAAALTEQVRRLQERLDALGSGVG